MSEDVGAAQETARGRPTAYEADYARQAAKLCELGATDDELADFFKVHRATIYRWKHEHDDFCDAVKTGKEVADERVERSLYQKATGYNVTEDQAVKLKTVDVYGWGDTSLVHAMGLLHLGLQEIGSIQLA